LAFGKSFTVAAQLAAANNANSAPKQIRFSM
jgi:hypothetical protein